MDGWQSLVDDIRGVADVGRQMRVAGVFNTVTTLRGTRTIVRRSWWLSRQTQNVPSPRRGAPRRLLISSIIVE